MNFADKWVSLSVKVKPDPTQTNGFAFALRRMENFRKLTEEERRLLAAQNCHAECWDEIEVAGAFDTAHIRNCGFKRKVRIAGKAFLSGIGSLAGYTIEEGAQIESVAVIEADGKGSFGNGVRAAVVNEGGGREVPLYAGLTAQTAYLIAMYRHRLATIEKIVRLAESEYSASPRECIIGRGSRIRACGILRNVTIGEDALIEGAALLENGSVCSVAGQRTYIGAGVKMRNFIVCGNSTVDNATLAERCFFGNGTHASSLSASDSLFFAGSHCENGEVCSVLAGPFTISHHKSTLLIAGLFSFFNAGSGTNFSNHLLKSGPVHQGVHQRGCKYGSGAYMMLPALDGAFTTVIGRHKIHPDTEAFPFSLLVEQDGESWLLPGANLASYGAARDFLKWPQRDRRDAWAEDIINFEECNPFTGERIATAIAVSEQLSAKAEGDATVYKKLRIKASMLRRGLKLYRLAQQKYIGAMLSAGHIPDTGGAGHWIDACGMFMPAGKMDEILDMVDSGEIASGAALRKALSEVHSRYGEYAAGWAASRLEQILGHAPSNEEVTEAIAAGKEAAYKLAALAADDLRSENDLRMAVSYGIDATDERTHLDDYTNVRKL